MINYRISFVIDDALCGADLSTSFPVRLIKGNKICFNGIEKTDLSDEFIFSLMNLINASDKGISYLGKVESKEDVIEFLEYAAWEVTNVIITPKYLWIDARLIR